jgi:hypothetical protein
MLPRSVLPLQTSNPASTSTKQLGAQQNARSVDPLFLRFLTICFSPESSSLSYELRRMPPKRAALRQPRIKASPHTPVVLSVPVFAGSTAPMPESTAELFSLWTAQLSGMLDDFQKQFRRRLTHEAYNAFRSASKYTRSDRLVPSQTVIRTNMSMRNNTVHSFRRELASRIHTFLPIISPVATGELRVLRGIPRQSVAFWGRT